MATAKNAKPASAGPGSRKGQGGAARRGGAAGRAARAPADTSSSGRGAKGLRVRMFRVGFGDFFLISVPTAGGPRHILIDCGVHAKDLDSIRSAVTQMAKDCNNKLALVIMTHRHADHISGFGKCSDLFAQFTVDRVWMPWFENRKNATAVAFQAGLTALAGRLALRLAARTDPRSRQLKDMAENITGVLGAAGVSANQKALDVLHNGFKNKPAPDYYKAGDPPTLPDDLAAAGLTAQILGPPIDAALIGQMTRKSQQYLAEAAGGEDGPVAPFADAFRAASSDYPAEAFEVFDPGEIAQRIGDAQPDALAAQAAAADKTLNNQSLVVLFSFRGKHLLFAGDAQWGNWENFLYGGAYGTPGHTELTPQAKDILGKINFYKVGHHGSANATPKDAVMAMAMSKDCVCMCSTQIDAYNEVPREPLLDALREHMKVARSDQVAINSDPNAEKELRVNPDAGDLPSVFKRPTGTLFIDYDF